MINYLINRIIKENDEINDLKVREKAGTLSSVVGVVCNIILFLLKILLGMISHSVSIISDAFNNLSDCLSCIVTLVAYKIAAKPADSEHPYGHGRMEYLSSLVIAVFICLVGFEFIKTSINRILNPQTILFSWIIVIMLSISIGLKFWMYCFNKILGNKMNSSTMLATAQDSLSDCFTTSVTLFSLVISRLTTFPIDSIAGLIVSFLILKSGYEILKDTVDELVGKPVDQETVDQIINLVLSHPEILGVHDILVHRYGPGNTMASLHAEVNSEAALMTAHNWIDDIENELLEQLHILAVIHLDPVDIQNPKLQKYKEMIEDTINKLGDNISFHDFRLVEDKFETVLLFDLVIPYDYRFTEEELYLVFKNLFKNSEERVICKINFDKRS